MPSERLPALLSVGFLWERFPSGHTSSQVDEYGGMNGSERIPPVLALKFCIFHFISFFPVPKQHFHFSESEIPTDERQKKQRKNTCEETKKGWRNKKNHWGESKKRKAKTFRSLGFIYSSCCFAISSFEYLWTSSTNTATARGSCSGSIP